MKIDDRIETKRPDELQFREAQIVYVFESVFYSLEFPTDPKAEICDVHEFKDQNKTWRWPPKE